MVDVYHGNFLYDLMNSSIHFFFFTKTYEVFVFNVFIQGYSSYGNRIFDNHCFSPDFV